MQVSDYSFEHLPFSDLFKTYVQDFQQLSDFYEINPFEESAITQRINGFEFSGDRQQTVDALIKFNDQFEIHEAARANLERLAEPQALTIVTGQQLGIYGGPLYTILKTLSVIHLSKKLERKHHRPIIPVFWMADEDHDYDEVRRLYGLNNDELASFELPAMENHLPTVADMDLPEEVQALRAELREAWYDTDFSDQLWDILDGSFMPGNTFFEAFGTFINKLFSKHGVILAGSNHPEIKNVTSGILQRSIFDADAIRKNLDEQSSRIGEQYHEQVTLYDSNLFYLDEKHGRTKISRNGNGWKTDDGTEWQTEQLVNEIENNPQKFSPNVFLRPILQDALLPTLGYVGGPGEIAYYGQMKGMYSCFDLTMPVIFPRLSGTIIEPAIDRILGELPFEFHEYAGRIEDLESDFVDRTEQHDIERIFEDWKKNVEQLGDPKKEEIAEIDPTLEGAAEKAMAAYFNELNKLKGKVYRAVKKKEEIQLERIRRIKANLFPDDGLQERVIAGIFYMNKYGVDIWDKVLNALDEDENFDHHKLIYL